MPDPKTTIIDGMALTQKLKVHNKTFSELANSVLSDVLREGSGSKCTDVVFDVYCDISIKNIERQHRGEQFGIQFSSIAPGHGIQHWRKLLRCGTSKTSLIKFFVSELQKKASKG